jgi:uncharacterized membrane protein
MIDKLYDLLAKMGYVHPIHPALTHVPIGAVMVAFCLISSFWLGRRQELLSSAYYVAAVGFVLLIPTAALGVLDWQHYYSGAWILPIQMKIALASLLFILLAITLVVTRPPHTRPGLMQLLFTLCLFNVMGLGYFGGELVYGGRVILVEKRFLAGQKIFVNHCSGCHVNGGNIFYPNLPLRSAPQLKSYETFIQFVRNPRLPNGLKGPMPDFTETKLSAQQAFDLYGYITNELAKSTREQKLK